MEEGKARGALRLEGFEKKVEVDGKEHVVKVVGWGAEFDEGRCGKKLLRIRITAEVDGVRNDYTITYSRRGVATRLWDAPTSAPMRLGASRQVPRGSPP